MELLKSINLLKANKKYPDKMVKCPYCGKEVGKNEMFCWHCENDLSELKNKREEPGSDSDE